MANKEFERAQVRELCFVCHVMLAAIPREGVVHVGVIMKRDEWIAIERRMNLRLRFRRAKLVEPGNVQHQRVTEVLRFIETLLDTDAVITNRTIRFEAR